VLRPDDPLTPAYPQDHLPSLTLTAIPSHTRHFPRQRANPYFSPALTPSGGWGFLVKHGVRVYVSAGSAEAMYDEIVALQRGMKRDGVDVELRVVSDE
jgi:acetyl esterase/lipase